MSQLLLAAYFFEVGLLLFVVPWSSLWDRNVLLESLPAIHEIARSNFVRGALSGLGVVNLAFGVAELVRFWAGRWGGRTSSATFIPRPEPPRRRSA